MSTSDDRPPLVLVVVGVGPRGAGLLERLAANAGASAPGPVEVHLVDPFPPGGGRVWRDAQSGLLRLNTTTEDLTAFVDVSVAMEGPVTPGPTMAEWCSTYGVDLVDPVLAAEAATIGPLDFPTRRLGSAYLGWAVDRTLGRLPDGVSVVLHPQRAVDLVIDQAGREVVVLEDGSRVGADAVVLTGSHVDLEPAARSAELVDFAVEHGLTYLPPDYAGDMDLEAVPAGADVLVRGFGLDFVDLMVLLTEGRGGRFVPVDGVLRYEGSGAEPHLLVGSRRGVPYHAKPTYRLRVPKPEHTRFCTPAAVADLLAEAEAEGRALDFRRDVWPLVGREAAWWAYRELGIGHADRIVCPWSEFARVFAELAWGSEAYVRWIERVVPDPADRFDPDAIDRPLRGYRAETATDLARTIRAYVEHDLARRADPRSSADLGVFYALLAVLPVIGPALGSARMDPRSLVEGFYGWFMGFFSFWASGPPPDRLQQLLALEEAGVVSFLGPGLEVRADAERRVFVATTSALPGERVARVLVDATLPTFELARARDPLLGALLRRGEVSTQVLRTPEGAPFDTGQLRTDAAHRLVRADGSVAERRFALGMHTAFKSPAFARPCTNAPVHRQNDAVARALLALPRSATDGRRLVGERG